MHILSHILIIKYTIYALLYELSDDAFCNDRLIFLIYNTVIFFSSSGRLYYHNLYIG